MEIKQISAILGDSLKQVFGEESITATDLTGIVSEGNKLITGADASIFDKLAYGLLDRVYKVVIGVRKYIPSASNIIRDYETYGAILEKVYYEPISAENNKTWELTNGSSVDPFTVKLVNTKVKIFSDRTTWEVPFTITEEQIKTAFLNASEMTVFVSGLFDIAENSMSLQVEKVAEFTRANFIGEKIAYDSEETKKGIPVVKLVTDYNTLYPDATVTRDNCLYNKEFLRYASATIRKWQKKLTKYSTLFNNDGFKRFTPVENQRLTFISDFIQQMETYLQSDTFHKELSEFPSHETVPFWQGSGDYYSFTDVSTIDIKTSGNNTIKATGILGVMFDRDSLGVTNLDRRVTSQYNAKAEFFNNWFKFDAGYFNDMNENFVVFFVA